MSKRLQVLLEEADLAEIKRLAERLDMTVAEWVRLILTFDTGFDAMPGIERVSS